MIAIVDIHVQRGVEIGAAAPAGLRRRLVERDLGAVAKLHRRRQAGEAGANDMNPRHQNIP